MIFYVDKRVKRLKRTQFIENNVLKTGLKEKKDLPPVLVFTGFDGFYPNFKHFFYTELAFGSRFNQSNRPIRSNF